MSKYRIDTFSEWWCKVMESTLHDLKLDMRLLVDNLILRIESIVQLLHNNEGSESHVRLAYLAEDITVLIQSAQLFRDTHIQFDLGELNEKLGMIIEQMEMKDQLFLADLLIFELKPLFEYWSEQLQDA